MIGLAVKELWGRKRRMAGSLTAVFLGVMFLTGTLVLGDTLAGSLDSYYSGSYARTDVIVRNSTDVSDTPWGSRGGIDASAVERVRNVDGVAHAAPLVRGSGQLLAADGTVIDNRGPRNAANWVTDPDLNPYRIDAGRAPRAPDEVVVNRLTAEQGNLGVGDRTAVLTPERVPVTIVGITMFGDEKAFGETSFTAFTLEGARRHLAGPDDRVGAVRIRADDGTDAAELAARVGAVLPAGAEAITAEAAIEESLGDLQSGFLGTFRVVLASFGGVALLVAAFTIHNTFAITVAQRTRESALLRALGVSRRQLRGMLSAEAVIMSLLGAVTGVLLGTVFGWAATRSLFTSFVFALPYGQILLYLALAVVAGLLAAVLPARRAAHAPIVESLSAD